MGVISYSPLGSGLLSGKYGPGMQAERGRLIENQMHRTRYSVPGLDIAERFIAHAQAHGVHPVRWPWRGSWPTPASPRPSSGARNLEQFEASLQALDFVMTPDWRAEISALSPDPPPATDRNEEQLGIILQRGEGG